MSASFVKIGDYITLKNLKVDGYLTAEGIFNDEIMVGDLKAFDNNLFQVCLPRQYSAAREFEEFIKQQEELKVEDEHEAANTQKHYEALERGKLNEFRLNESYMKNKFGDTIRYGDSIQLMHVKSKKFITIIGNEVAHHERENIHVCLHSHGNNNSWLVIQPRFKINQTGDYVFSNSEIKLNLAERASEYLHCAENEFQKGLREVNASLDPSSWLLSIYQNSTDILDTSLVLSSQLVYLFDPETHSVLNILKRPLIFRQVGKDDDCFSEVSDDDSIMEISEYGDVIIEPMEDSISTNSLWILESRNYVTGGPVQWKTEHVRLRHVNTGLYLSMNREYKSAKSDLEAYNLAVSMNPMDKNNLLAIHELHGSHQFLQDKRAVQINHGHTYLARGDIREVSQHSHYLCKGLCSANQALYLFLTKYQEDYHITGSADDYVLLNQPLDVTVGGAIKTFLQDYLDKTAPFIDYDVNSDFNDVFYDSVWPGKTNEEVAWYYNMIERSIQYLHDIPISETIPNVEQTKLCVKSPPSSKRQKMIRELGCLDIILYQLNSILYIFKGSSNNLDSTSIASQTLGITKQMSHQENEDTEIGQKRKSLMRMAGKVAKSLLRLLFSVLKGNRTNQMYAAKHMHVVLGWVGVLDMAASVVREMLHDNLELQQKCITEREVNTFTEQLLSSESRMNSMYFNMLQSFCTCSGKGISKNQGLVMNAIFPIIKRVFVRIEPVALNVTEDNNGLDTFNTSIYVDKSKFDDSNIVVLGKSLLEDGIAQLAVSWQSSTVDYSSLTLFGKDLVPLFELFKPQGAPRAGMQMTLLRTISKLGGQGSPSIRRQSSFGPKQVASDESSLGPRNISAERRVVVGQYLVAELHLAAALCLDRNYSAIAQLEKLFSYEVLISILMSYNGNIIKTATTSSINDLKGAAAKLITHLYVDRESETTSHLPCLSRAWNELAAGEAIIPGVEDEREYRYCLLQHILSEHLRNMNTDGGEWEAFSYYMMQIMHKLVELQFYGSKEKLLDIIQPMLNVLNRTNVEIEIARSKSMRLSHQNSLVATLNLKAVDETLSSTFSTIVAFLQAPGYFIATMVLAAIACVLAVLQVTIKLDHVGIFAYYVILLFMTAVELSLKVIDIHRNSPDFASLIKIFADYDNGIDFVVIVADVVAFVLGPSLIGNFANTLRLLKLIPFGYFGSESDANENEEAITWTTPLRYTVTPESDLNTMVEMTGILCSIQNILSDRNLSLALIEFYRWVKNHSCDAMVASSLFAKAVNEAHELTVLQDNADQTILDLIMYAHPALAQSSLELLMSDHSIAATMLENMCNSQILATSMREKQFDSVHEMILRLDRYIETHALWCQLRNDKEREISATCISILKGLVDICRKRLKILQFDEDYEPDPVMQNLLKNFGCFEVCFKLVHKLSMAAQESFLSEAGQNTRQIMLGCNNVLYWFCLDNPVNQETVFSELDFFIETIDNQINSHKVLYAIFKNNEKLMHKVPLQLLSEFADKICKQGRFPQYLSLMSAICNIGEKNILENQYEIVKQLASPLRIKKVLLFFCPVTNHEYHKKVKLMTPYAGKKDLSIDDVASELAYHLELMKVLTGCTVGVFNIATIETKVQQMFNIVDLIDAIMDPQCIMLVKIKSGLFLYNAMLDVEMALPGLSYMPSIWRLLFCFREVLSSAKDDLRQVERNGWESPTTSRQKIEYIVVSIMVIRGFFKNYYDPMTFKRESGPLLQSKTEFTYDGIKTLIDFFFDKMKQIYELDTFVLGVRHKSLIYEALEYLCRAREISIQDFIEPTHLKEAKHILNRVKDDDLEKSEEKLGKALQNFVSTLQKDENVLSILSDEFQKVITLIEALPSIRDTSSVSSVRYEPFLEKLVTHFKQGLAFSNHGATRIKTMSDRMTKTATWVIKMFRTMIENRWGMTIDERDDDGGEEQDDASESLVRILNKSGATTLCIDLIAPGIEQSLALECIKLLVAMLFREGGSTEVQITMYEYLASSDSEFFFRQVRTIIQRLISWHDWKAISPTNPADKSEDNDDELPEEIIIIRCMQLMCEGHYISNQDIFREQPDRLVSINLLDDLVSYMVALTKIPSKLSTKAALSVASACLEVIQGPCEKNQDHFALNTSLVETLNHQLRARIDEDRDACDETELKKAAIDILQGLLEGQGKKTAVYERVLSVIHLDVIQLMCNPEKVDDDDEEAGKEEDHELAEITGLLQTEALVLLQMFCDFKPSLRSELEALKKLDDGSSKNKVACVEVLWRGELQRRFFNIPQLCDNFADATKKNFVEYVDRSSQENKLLDMYERAAVIYKELLHQRWLEEVNLAWIFTRQNQNRATWFTFMLACAINLVFVGFFTGSECLYDEDGSINCNAPYLEPKARKAVDILNILQIASSSFTLVMFLVVRVPVLYQVNAGKGLSVFWAVMETASDPLTMYYFVYVILATLAYSIDHLVTLLLLDIVVKNTYALDVFIAIITPIKQLSIALILCALSMYIFAMFLFKYWCNPSTMMYPNDCDTLYNCFKFIVTDGKSADFYTMYQLPFGNLWFFHYFFDIAMRFMLMNVIRGITADTFQDLRIAKLVRMKNTTETCFICGFEKEVFDRDNNCRGFKTHIALEHNMWNYLYFMIYIWEQDKDDDDGLEQYVRRCIDANDISWLPSNRAISLTPVEEKEGTSLKDVYLNDVKNVENKFVHKMNHFKGDISKNLSKIRNILDDAIANAAAGDNFDEFLEMPVFHPTSAPSTQESLALSAFAATKTNNNGVLEAKPEETKAKEDASPTLKKQTSSPMLNKSTSFALLRQQSKFAMGQSIYVEVLEVFGLNLPTRHLENLVCRVCYPTGFKQVEVNHVNSVGGERVAILTFPPNKVCVYEGYDSTKANVSIKIQIAYIAHPGELPKYLGHVFYTLSELASMATPASTGQVRRSFIAKVRNEEENGILVVNVSMPSL